MKLVEKLTGSRWVVFGFYLDSH